MALYWLVAASSLRAPSDQVRAITTLGYRNQALCYSRTVAYFSGSAMLFSSGDSPQSASSNLSGEGFDEVQPGGSPLLFPPHSTCLALLRQSRPTRLNPGTIWCILWGPGVRYASLLSGTKVSTRRSSPSAPFPGLITWKGASITAAVDLPEQKAHWRTATRRSPAPALTPAMTAFVGTTRPLIMHSKSIDSIPSFGLSL
jgi:hypothetical protein